MKNLKHILILVSVTVFALLASKAFGFSKVKEGRYDVALTPRSCEILTEPTVVKRGLCAAVMSAGTQTSVMSVISDGISVQGWEPSLLTWNGAGYVGQSRSVGILTRCGFLAYDSSNGMVEDEVYLPGSSTPDIYVISEVHWW